MSDPIQIRDPIHNFISLNEEQVKVIDSPIFQRLRNIKQLALASLIYPGALHTRFDHSLGVFHVAKSVLRRLELDGTDEARVVEFAALLHDLGHGPFSHVSEQSLEMFADRSSLPSDQKKEKIHELITAHLIETDPDIEEILGKNRSRQVTQLLNAWPGDPVFRSIISGPLDADKLDYLLRDSYFCGVAYGRFDFAQLERSLCCVKKQLMLRKTGVTAFEQYALAKHYITQNVYRHKGRLVTDAMITRAIALGIRTDKLPAMQKLYCFDGTPAFYKNYVTWHDARFMTEFAGVRAKQGKCKDVLCRLVDRRLFKRVFSLGLESFSYEVKTFMGNYIDKPETVCFRMGIERAVSDVLSFEFKSAVDPDLVILNKVKTKPIHEMAMNDGQVLVNGHEQPEPINEVSKFLDSVGTAKAGAGVDLEMYAPVEWLSRSRRDAVCERIKQSVVDVIEQAVREEAKGHDSV